MEAASALQIACVLATRWWHRRADPGPHGRLAVKLDGSPSSGCSVVLATHTAGAVSVDGYTLTLAVNLWNIVRTYNLTPGQELRLPLPARHGLQLRAHALRRGTCASAAAPRPQCSASVDVHRSIIQEPCTRRKAAEEVISLSSCGIIEKARKRELGIFLFFRFRQSTPRAAVPERAPEAPRGTPSRA